MSKSLNLVMKKLKTVGEYSQSRNNNYNLIRFIAAFFVLFSHCYPLSLGRGTLEPFANSLKESLGSIAVSIFFTISGFLVTQSFLVAKNILFFLEARLLRLYPALIISVLLCVFLLGCVFTIFPLTEYLSKRSIYVFLIYNASLYHITYNLPGVFLNNPYPAAVNGSLWVLPLFLKMYVLVGLFGVLTILRRRSVFNTLFLFIIIIFLFSPDFLLVRHEYLKPSFAFLLGGFLYVNRIQIPLTGYIAIALWGLPLLFYHLDSYWICFQIALAYSIFWFAYVPAGFLRYFNNISDYSYGIYIYAFPIQQMIAACIEHISPMQMAIYSSLLTFGLAFLSLHLIEKPVLKYKGIFSLYFTQKYKELISGIKLITYNFLK